MIYTELHSPFHSIFPDPLSISPFHASPPFPCSKQPSTAPLGRSNGSSKRATTCLVALLWRTMAPYSLRAIQRQGRRGKRRASAPCTGSTPPGTYRGGRNNERRRGRDGKTGTTNDGYEIIVTMRSGGSSIYKTLSFLPPKKTYTMFYYEYQTPYPLPLRPPFISNTFRCRAVKP